MAFRGTLSRRQQDTLDRFTAASPRFAAMRKLAMNFRAILFSNDSARLDAWLTEANASGPHRIRSFARWLMRDLHAVRNAITEPWSNGQAEGQINKLKTLKRSMHGRALSCCAPGSFRSKVGTASNGLLNMMRPLLPVTRVRWSRISPMGRLQSVCISAAVRGGKTMRTISQRSSPSLLSLVSITPNRHVELGVKIAPDPPASGITGVGGDKQWRKYSE
jgi:hypothetical protein